jgi:oxygen-independent coproporphyrinogen-3 oxidase
MPIMSATPSTARADAPPGLSEALLRRFDAPGPRYTSYPTADRFVEAFGPADAIRALEQRAHGATVGGPAPLSVYVHIPFCESVCYYCACNKVITRHHERAAEYLDALDTEIGLVRAALGPGQQVSQLHFGGGSPTFLSDAELDRVVASLRHAFRIAAGAEMSIEIDAEISPGADHAPRGKADEHQAEQDTQRPVVVANVQLAHDGSPKC